MFAFKAKIYWVIYNQSSSIEFDETSSHWSAPKFSPLNPAQKGDVNKNGRVATSESIPIHFKGFANVSIAGIPRGT